MQEALLIVDMSYDFVADDGGLTVGTPGQDIVPYIIRTAQSFLDQGHIVAFAVDAHQPEDPHFERWPVHNVVGTVGQRLYGELQEWYDNNHLNPHVLYIPKTNYNAFFQTDLANQLRNFNVAKVHVVGVCTDICDFLTVAGSDAEGFKTAAHRRGMATFTDQTEVFLKHMQLCFHTEIID